MTEEAAAWRQDLRARAEEWVRRRAAQAAARQAAARRRAHGLIDRHAARMARMRQSEPGDPDAE